MADVGPQRHGIYPPCSATDQEGAACPEQAWYSPGRDRWWDDQDGQQPSLVQGLGQVGEHVDETPAKNPEIRDRKPRGLSLTCYGAGAPVWALSILEGSSVALHHADAQGGPAGPAGATLPPNWACSECGWFLSFLAQGHPQNSMGKKGVSGQHLTTFGLSQTHSLAQG